MVTHTKLSVTWQKHRLPVQVYTVLGRDGVPTIRGWKLLGFKIPTQQKTHHFNFWCRSNDHFSEGCPKGEKTRVNWRRLLECFHQLAFHLPTWFLQFILIPQSSRRVVHSINTPMYYRKLSFDDYDLLTTYGWSQPRCQVPCTPLFFPVLQELVNRSLWGSLLSPLWLQFGCVVLCGLVLAYGFAVVRRSSRSLRVFSASLLVAWSHPTFVRYKAFAHFL
jgi:hypothetical protein